MELLDIKKYPAKILRKRCSPVEEITEKEKRLFEDMLFTMRHFGGIGLAAPQVGVSKRLIIADMGEGAIKLANPEIVEIKGTDKMEEGCLSIPDIKVEIERPYEIIIRGVDAKGDSIELKAEALIARVLQHEVDHLDGKLIVDYAGLLERFKWKLRKK